MRSAKALTLASRKGDCKGKDPSRVARGFHLGGALRLRCDYRRVVQARLRLNHSLGLRSIRYWKEIPNLQRILVNDIDPVRSHSLSSRASMLTVHT